MVVFLPLLKSTFKSRKSTKRWKQHQLPISWSTSLDLHLSYAMYIVQLQHVEFDKCCIWFTNIHTLAVTKNFYIETGNHYNYYRLFVILILHRRLGILHAVVHFAMYWILIDKQINIVYGLWAQQCWLCALSLEVHRLLVITFKNKLDM